MDQSTGTLFILSPGKITPEETKHLYLNSWYTERYMLKKSERNKRVKKKGFHHSGTLKTTGRP